MICNKCCTQLESNTKAVATACGHLYCYNCAEEICGSDSPECVACGEALMKSNLKLVHVLQDSSAFKLFMFGQTPEVILQTAQAAINFYSLQQQVVLGQQGNLMMQRMEKIKDGCKKKLEEMQAGAKRKVQEVSQQRYEVEQENRELHEKYQQKSNQVKRLQQLCKELQHRNESETDNRHSSRGGLTNNILSGGAPVRGGSGSLSPFSGGGPAITTHVHRTQAMYSNIPGLEYGNQGTQNGRNSLGGGQPRAGGNSPLSLLGNGNLIQQNKRASVSPRSGMFMNMGQQQPQHRTQQTLPKLLPGGGISRGTGQQLHMPSSHFPTGSGGSGMIGTI